MTATERTDSFMKGLIRRNPGEVEFHQAVREFVNTVMPYVMDHRKYIDGYVLERLTEPDRVVSFRVSWEDDRGNIRANRGFRVQFCNAIGPYKGGLRFHPSVNLSILKFLGFEQTFKNSLSTLPMGGGKGGANFNPKGKSDREVMRFCQAFMTQLERYIGPETDVPAGDIGVGRREVNFMFGQYKRMRNRFVGVLTGKGLELGGSLIRPEATGYGCVYFAQSVLEHVGEGLAGKRCVVSGSGNVAQHAIEKILHLGGIPLTASDSGGFILDPTGITVEKLAWIKEHKNEQRGRMAAYAEAFPGSTFHAHARPWAVPCDVAFPCATQNEVNAEDASTMIKLGCRLVCEGANMPSTLEAIARFRSKGVLFAPGKAANAGGVTVSGLEMTQNSMRLSWPAEEVDNRLRDIMHKIHDRCVEFGGDGDQVDYLTGANIGGFVKVADAVLAQGIV